MKNTRQPVSMMSVGAIWAGIVSVTVRLSTLTSNFVSTLTSSSTGESRCPSVVSYFSVSRDDEIVPIS